MKEFMLFDRPLKDSAREIARQKFSSWERSNLECLAYEQLQFCLRLRNLLGDKLYGTLNFKHTFEPTRKAIENLYSAGYLTEKQVHDALTMLFSKEVED